MQNDGLRSGDELVRVNVGSSFVILLGTPLRGCTFLAALVLFGCKADGGRAAGNDEATGGASGEGGGAQAGGADQGQGGTADEAKAGRGGAASEGMPSEAGVADAASTTKPDAASTVSDPGTEGDGDFVIGPQYTAHPDVLAKANVPHGKVYKFSLPSKGTLFEGLDKSLAPANQKLFSREVQLYVPKQYVDGKAAPFMVVQDGGGYAQDVTTTLDNLIAAKKLPVMLAVFVNNGGGDGQDSQRGLEYDTLSDRYARFIDRDVLPAAQKQAAVKADYPNLKFTDDPEGRSSYGCSSGGAAALTQGWFTPDRYRRIVTYSGTFVAQQDNQGVKAPEAAQYPWGAWEYHSDQSLIQNSPKKPLRIFMHVGENDLNLDARFGDQRHNWMVANQRTAAALKQKGYHYRFVFAKGSGHCDNNVRRATLPDTLTWMWRGYPIESP